LPQTTRMRVLILDNYDSFTYNLYDYVASFGVDVTVLRNDEVEIADVDKFTHIILSPGPGLPKDAGIMPELIRTFAQTKSILGVCLGMQGIAEYFGAELYNLETVRHGRQFMCNKVANSKLLNKLPEQFEVGLYHSWAVKNLPDELILTSLSEENVVMSFEHKNLYVFGVQFHPESVLTPLGKDIINAFLDYKTQD